LDRFDLCLHAEATSFTSLQNHELGETTDDIAARVRAARRCQSLRFSAHDEIHSNADAHGKVLTQTCALTTETIGWLHKALDHFQLSPRGYHGMLQVARTTANLEGGDKIENPHLSEALSFRPFPAYGQTAKQAD
jgi:magnesium chelatase family protein